MSERRIDVRFEPNHEDPQMGDARTPMLTFGWRPDHGNIWTLWYRTPGGNGIEDYVIPGDLTDVADVVADAQRWLDLVDAEPSD